MPSNPNTVNSRNNARGDHHRPDVGEGAARRQRDARLVGDGAAGRVVRDDLTVLRAALA